MSQYKYFVATSVTRMRAGAATNAFRIPRAARGRQTPLHVTGYDFQKRVSTERICYLNRDSKIQCNNTDINPEKHTMQFNQRLVQNS